MSSYQKQNANPKRYLKSLFATPLYSADLNLNLTNLEHFCKKHQQKNKKAKIRVIMVGINQTLFYHIKVL